MNKTKIIIGLVVIAIALIAGIFYWQEYTSTEAYQAKKIVEEWEQRYREDTFGGSTPEETLQLFIDALKRGDTDTAAKYFVLDEQDKWREELKSIQDRKLLNSMIADLENLKLSGREDNRAFYALTDKTNLVLIEMVIILSSSNGLWKIMEL